MQYKQKANDYSSNSFTVRDSRMQYKQKANDYIIDKAGGFSAKSPKQLSMRMAEYFGNTYLNYYATNLDVSNDQLLMKQYVKSQNNLFEYIKQEVTRQIVTANYLGDIEKSIWFASRLIQKARQELFNPRFEIGSMRWFLEDKINSEIAIFPITFSGIKDPTNPLSTDFELQISQSDFYLIVWLKRKFLEYFSFINIPK